MGGPVSVRYGNYRSDKCLAKNAESCKNAAFRGILRGLLRVAKEKSNHRRKTLDPGADIRALREALGPTLRATGRAFEHLDDEQFAGRLRRFLMALTGGEPAVGFDYCGTRTTAGDFKVTLEWSDAAMEIVANTSRTFTAHGATETLAFLRAAQDALRHPGYLDMLFRTPWQDKTS